MKHILIRLMLILCLTCCLTPAVQAGWFDAGKEHQQQLVKVEEELTVQRNTKDTWIVIAGVLGVGCVLLLVIGTALGATVRRRHAPKS